MLAYTATSGGCHVVLRGIDEYKDSPYVVLDWVDRKYTLFGVYVVGWSIVSLCFFDWPLLPVLCV